VQGSVSVWQGIRAGIIGKCSPGRNAFRIGRNNRSPGRLGIDESQAHIGANEKRACIPETCNACFSLFNLPAAFSVCLFFIFCLIGSIEYGDCLLLTGSFSRRRIPNYLTAALAAAPVYTSESASVTFVMHVLKTCHFRPRVESVIL